MVILHMTDLHISADGEKEFLKRWNALCSRIYNLPAEWEPDVLAFTGDFYRYPAASAYLTARKCIRDFVTELNIGRENIISCPGNHDLQRKADANIFTDYEMLQHSCFQENNQMVKDGIQFLSVNSCRNMKNGQYDKVQVEERELEKLQKGAVVLMHHPIELLDSQEAQGKIISRARLILTGHMHVSEPVVTRIGEMWSVNGCAVSPADSSSPCGCQLIRLEDDGTIQLAALISQSQEYPWYEFKRFDWGKREHWKNADYNRKAEILPFYRYCYL